MNLVNHKQCEQVHTMGNCLFLPLSSFLILKIPEGLKPPQPAGALTGSLIYLLTNSLEASSDKTAPIVSHIVRIESGPKQFSGVELSGPASPIGEAALAGEDAISSIRN